MTYNALFRSIYSNFTTTQSVIQPVVIWLHHCVARLTLIRVPSSSPEANWSNTHIGKHPACTVATTVLSDPFFLPLITFSLPYSVKSLSKLWQVLKGVLAALDVRNYTLLITSLRSIVLRLWISLPY